MKTIITIKKNKPAYKALVLLAKELEKSDHTAISVSEEKQKEKKIDIIMPSKEAGDPFSLFGELSDFPTLEELRKQAWPKI